MILNKLKQLSPRKRDRDDAREDTANAAKEANRADNICSDCKHSVLLHDKKAGCSGMVSYQACEEFTLAIMEENDTDSNGPVDPLSDDDDADLDSPRRKIRLYTMKKRLCRCKRH